jgi:PAS domain S-box-containing protein
MTNKYDSNGAIPIIVVDDSPESLILLSEILIRNNYKVYGFERGEKIVQKAKEINPHLIILDIMMPDIDGIEVCRKLKSDITTKDIPIIFISAIGDSKTITEGFNVGGVDYITKPISAREVLARAATHIKLFTLQKELEQKNLALEEEIRKGQRNKRALEESLRLFHELFNASPDSIILIDPNDRQTSWPIVDCNLAACKLNGYTREELVGKSIDILNAEEQTQEDHDRYFVNLKEKKTISFETPHRHKDGRIIILEVLTTIVSIGGKEYILGIDRDITERKKGEQELIKAKEKAEESDRLKSAFLANMSHEIRTPLNSILGFSELLGNPNLTSEDREEYSRLVETSGNNLLSIINDIIDISKIESGLLEIINDQFNVNHLIKNIAEVFEFRVKQKGLSLIVRNCDKDIVMVNDRSKIYQILSNFLSNAIKFTNKGNIELGVIQIENSLKIYVKDTGIGINNDFQEHIFKRFRQAENAFTRKYGGNGLGLSISKHLIELLGGKIGLNSQFGKGSTFYILLPYS